MVSAKGFTFSIIEPIASSFGNIKEMIKHAIWRRRLHKAIASGLHVGDDCNISRNVFFGSRPYLISIGNHVEVSADVAFVTHAGADEWLFGHTPEYSDLKYYDNIEIKDNCFIGLRAIILPGVTIGPNSIVGAGAVVTRNVPPNTVVSGNPARVVSSTSMYLEIMKGQAFPYDPELRKDTLRMREKVEENLDELHARRSEALVKVNNDSDRVMRRVN